MSKYVDRKYVGHILCRQKKSENMSRDLRKCVERSARLYYVVTTLNLIIIKEYFGRIMDIIKKTISCKIVL